MTILQGQSVERIEISPVLLQKGNTKPALYCIEHLYNQEIMLRPKEDQDAGSTSSTSTRTAAAETKPAGRTRSQKASVVNPSQGRNIMDAFQTPPQRPSRGGGGPSGGGGGSS
ncbi:hypothetical protein J4Q44_G00339270 [Coregonus suidteri]|uniref:Uncharacterized protein n=1 Tax=Coregonus suidteri TaxID=861788 RepID=A0AAN8KK16_9TELE